MSKYTSAGVRAGAGRARAGAGKGPTLAEGERLVERAARAVRERVGPAQLTAAQEHLGRLKTELKGMATEQVDALARRMAGRAGTPPPPKVRLPKVTVGKVGKAARGLAWAALKMAIRRL